MPVFFPDVSEWQPNVDADALVAAGYRALVARVCYGTRLDATMPARRDYLRARVPVLGWYLFLRAGQDVTAQVNAFTSVVPSLGRYEFAAVDWEHEGAVIPTVGQRNLAMGLLEQRLGRKPWLYGAPAALAANPPPNGEPLWPAAYGQSDPRVKGEVAWQFTDGRYTSFPGLTPVYFPGIGLCDASVYPGTYAQLETLIGGAPSPVASPDSKEPTMLTNCAGPLVLTPSGKGYWRVQADGGVFQAGDARFFGSVPGVLKPGQRLAAPIVGMAAHPKGTGYWLVGADGGVFCFGAAKSYGSVPASLKPGQKLAKPIDGITASPTGLGYYLTAGDGGVFCFGDAHFESS